MSILSYLLSILIFKIKCAHSLQDFRLTLQITGDRVIGDGVMVRTNCITGVAKDDGSPYSDWALGPAQGLNAMQAISIGIEQCGTGTIADTDIRICLQVASNQKDGQMQCTDWASDGAGGWSPFARTVDDEHVYKARIMIDTRTKSGLEITDIEAGLQAADGDDETSWGKSRYTGFIQASEQNSLYARPVFGENVNNPIEAIKVYFEADIGSSWCCTLAKGKPKYSDECTTDEKSADKETCEANTASDANSRCKWSDCSSVGFCQWDGILGRSTKEKRTCTGYTNEIDCNQGNGGRSGCEWKRGPTPQWYAIGEVGIIENELAVDDNDFTANMMTIDDINWIFVSVVSLFLMIFVFVVRKWTNVGDKDANFKNEYTPMIQI